MRRRCEQCGVHALTALPTEDDAEVLPEVPKELVLKNKEQQERDEKAKQATAPNSPNPPTSAAAQSSGQGYYFLSRMSSIFSMLTSFFDLTTLFSNF